MHVAEQFPLPLPVAGNPGATTLHEPATVCDEQRDNLPVSDHPGCLIPPKPACANTRIETLALSCASGDPGDKTVTAPGSQAVKFNLTTSSGEACPKEIEIGSISDLLALVNSEQCEIIVGKAAEYSHSYPCPRRYPHPYTLEIYDTYRE